MKCFLLQVAIVLGAGLATGFAFTLNSKVQLRVPLNINNNLPAKPPVKAPNGPTGVTTPTGNAGVTGTETPVANSTATPPAANTELFIGLDLAKKLFDSKNAVFIDARPKNEYLTSHVLGAMQLEKGDLDGQPPAKVDYLVGSTVVVYCHGELCTDSENVIKRLAALNKGIGPFHILKVGFPGWEAAKYPVDAGPEIGFQ